MSREVMENRPLYPIGIVAELLEIHPQTIRVWEKYGVVHPQKISGKRFYSNSDLSRLRFVLKLTEERLNKAAVSRYVSLYPCWNSNKCLPCMHVSKENTCGKPCWKEDGFYCIASYDENLCSNCEFNCR
ncbi:MerR family transcriptional regulator [Chloroflexota bacterium]